MAESSDKIQAPRFWPGRFFDIGRAVNGIAFHYQDHAGKEDRTMETRIAELRYKEVISVEDGSRFGFVGDMEVDLDSGQVRALVVPGRRRLFGLLGREEDRYIPWNAVRRFGEDIILVEDDGSRRRPRRG